MLPKKYRTTVSEFYKNKQTGQKINLSLFTVFLKTNEKSVPHFVISVSKALDKRSVYRHLTKRLVGEEISSQLDNFKNLNYDFSFKMKKIINKENKLFLEKEISQMIKDIHIYIKTKPI